uniref:AMP-activated protein kinase gamma regulatory subunit n=1 Tax=Rhizophora mucronata TaxID=61149 RepID=A0A2P2KPR3_RHIMU
MLMLRRMPPGWTDTLALLSLPESLSGFCISLNLHLLGVHRLRPLVLLLHWLLMG